ncbi:MAG: PEP-CTERM sorting domain-containing protein, partial [Fimbriimonadaceae bacterium]
SFGNTVVMWDENVQGDLSGNHLLPNNVSVSVGSNNLIGSTGNSDRDYFHFSLAPGQALTGIILRNYVSMDDISFLAVQEGTFFTEDPNNAHLENLLGWTFFGTPEIGSDLLPVMGSNFGSIGFTPPLTGSDYTFWLQQTGDPTDYHLDFQVVPEPTTLAALTGMAGLLLRRRKAKTSN